MRAAIGLHLSSVGYMFCFLLITCDCAVEIRLVALTGIIATLSANDSQPLERDPYADLKCNPLGHRKSSE